MECLQSKRIVFTNNYEDYLDEIRQGCEKGLNRRDIFRSITGLGFRGKLTAFYHWFHNCFPGYDSKYKRNELQAAPIENRETIRFGALSPRKLAICVENPGWGISKKTGECSRENRFAQKIIASCELLQKLRYVGQSFRKIITRDDEGALMTWLSEVKQLNIGAINSFVKGARVIWRELKEIYSTMSQAIRFFFSKRTITTVRGGERIVTDFDGGFDSVTILSAGAASGSELKSGSAFKSKPELKIKPGSESGSVSSSNFGSLIQAHIRTIESHSQALTQASAFAGTIISIALKVITGPCGWIRLGMEVIGSVCQRMNN
jgi:hypothetical protein